MVSHIQLKITIVQLDSFNNKESERSFIFRNGGNKSNIEKIVKDDIGDIYIRIYSKHIKEF